MHKNRDIIRDSPGAPHNGNGYTTHARGGQSTVPSNPPEGDNKYPVAASSFAARFGRAIVQHGIAAIPSALFHHQGSLDLSAQEVWFISYVMCFKWDENLPRVNLSQMEKRVGMGKRSLYRLKERLCEGNYLKVSPVFTENGRQDCSAYDFSGLFEELERLILADPPKTNPIHTDDTSDDDTDEEPAERDMSFLARFGRVIARYGIAAVPQAIFTYQAALGLKPQQVWFIAYIFSYQWKKALPYPSIVKMSARTGYSTVQLHEIKASLVDLGYLRLVPRSTRYGGRDTNAYDFSGLFDALRAHLQREHAQGKTGARRDATPAPQPTTRPRPSRRRGRIAAQHATRNQGDAELLKEGDARLSWEDDSQLTYQGDSELAWQGGSEQAWENDSEFREDGGPQFTGESGPRLTPHTNRWTPTRMARSLQKRVTPGLHNVEAIQEENKTKRKDDSNHLPPGKNRVRNETSSAPPPVSTYIVAVMDDYSNELNDPDHKVSNVTQALRLWQASELTEHDFIQMVYEAKQVTRKYQGKNGLRGIENKMAYFFAVLKDLCGLRSDTPIQGSATKPPQDRPGVQPTTKKLSSRADSAMTNARQLWQAALTELQVTVPAPSFQTWLKNTSIAAFENDTVVIAVPSNFAKEWLEKRYSKQIAQTLNNVVGYKVQVQFEVSSPGATR